MRELVLHRRTAKYFERLEVRIQTQLRARFAQLAEDPFTVPGVRPMSGEWKGFFRLRHGDLRIIFMIDPAGTTVIIANIGPRGDVYK